MPNITGFISKLGNDRIGQLAGFLMAEAKAGQLRGTGLFGNINNQIKAALTELHIPNFEHLIYGLTAGGWRTQMLQQMLLVSLGGYLAKEMKLHPQVTKFGNLASKLGFNAAIGVVAEAVVEYSTISHSKTIPYSEGTSHPTEGAVMY